MLWGTIPAAKCVYMESESSSVSHSVQQMPFQKNQRVLSLS
jgi:hypothetical protein